MPNHFSTFANRAFGADCSLYSATLKPKLGETKLKNIQLDQKAMWKCRNDLLRKVNRREETKKGFGEMLQAIFMMDAVIVHFKDERAPEVLFHYHGLLALPHKADAKTLRRAAVGFGASIEPGKPAHIRPFTHKPWEDGVKIWGTYSAKAPHQSKTFKPGGWSKSADLKHRRQRQPEAYLLLDAFRQINVQSAIRAVGDGAVEIKKEINRDLSRFQKAQKLQMPKKGYTPKSSQGGCQCTTSDLADPKGAKCA